MKKKKNDDKTTNSGHSNQITVITRPLEMVIKWSAVEVKVSTGEKKAYFHDDVLPSTASQLTAVTKLRAGEKHR